MKPHCHHFQFAWKVLFRKRLSNSDFCFSIYLWGLVAKTIQQQHCQSHRWHFFNFLLKVVPHEWNVLKADDIFIIKSTIFRGLRSSSSSWVQCPGGPSHAWGQSRPTVLIILMERWREEGQLCRYLRKIPYSQRSEVTNPLLWIWYDQRHHRWQQNELYIMHPVSNT